MCVPSQNLKINILDVHWLARGCAQSGSSSPATNETTTNPSEAMQGQQISPDLNVETVQITTFSNEGEVSQAEHVRPSEVPTGLDVATRDALENSVIGFLQRKIQINTVDWHSTDSQGSVLHTMNLPSRWFQETMITQKLAGFRYLRCDFRYTIQVNAQPFNAGMLIVAYYPMNKQLTHIPSNQHHLGGITGYRHVILDLAQSTSAEMVIPFSPVMANIDLIKGTGTFGEVKCYVYSPLTGLSDVDFTIWIAAENVVVEMPTGLPQLLPTSGVAQVNLSAEKKRPGSVETTSRSIGAVAKLAQTIPIPLVNGIATVASTVADAVSGVASIFGWSKPSDPEFPVKVELGYGKYLSNTNGDAKIKSLAFDARTSVETPFSLSNTDEDEMAISTIVSRPTYLTSFNFAKIDSPGALLLSLPTCPSACLKTNVTFSGGSGTAMYNTFLSYLSQMFIAYRGALKYTFRVVKTPFHSGRIGVVFVPGATPATSFASVDQSSVYRVIYDLRETSTIEFEVPFVYNTPFKTLRADFPTVEHEAMVYTVPTGMLYVFVVNSLRNPSTAADSIQVIVEVAGGDDFQFAGPMIQPPPHSQYKRSIVRSGEIAGPIARGTAQADIVPMSKTAFAMNQFGVGEVVQSLRSVLKRYTRPNFQIPNPFSLLHASWQTTVPTSTGLLTQNPDYYSWVSQLYRFQVGGMRLAVLQSLDSPKMLRYEVTAPGLGMLLADAFASDGQRANTYQFAFVEPLVELGLPFYQTTPAILSIVGDPIVADAESQAGGLPTYNTLMPFNEGTGVTIYDAITNALVPDEFITNNLALARAVAEDFSFMYLIGPPITAAVVAA